MGMMVGLTYYVEELQVQAVSVDVSCHDAKMDWMTSRSLMMKRRRMRKEELGLGPIVCSLTERSWSLRRSCQILRNGLSLLFVLILGVKGLFL